MSEDPDSLVWMHLPAGYGYNSGYVYCKLDIDCKHYYYEPPIPWPLWATTNKEGKVVPHGFIPTEYEHGVTKLDGKTFDQIEDEENS